MHRLEDGNEHRPSSINTPCLKRDDNARGNNALNQEHPKIRHIYVCMYVYFCVFEREGGVITAYKIVKISSPDWICQRLGSLSAKAAMTKNCSKPKKHVKEVSDSLAGYFFTTGACKCSISQFYFLDGIVLL